MSEWALKRFWTKAEVAPEGTGFAVRLDGRGVKTPAKTPLVVPTAALAEQIALEWQAQEDKIDPATMPFTRMSNSALDKVTLQHAEVAAMLAAYGDSDLLCYRADGPAGLVARQSEGWDPVLGWSAEALQAPLTVQTGVMHQPQDPAVLARFGAAVLALTPFQLAAFHDLVSMSGSLVLGFAVTHGVRSAEAAWTLSRIDETWQAEQWGADEEAEETAEIKRAEFLHAAHFYTLTSG